MREFKDQHGTRWEAFEVSSATLTIGRPEFLPPAFRSGWLTFDNGTERRRLAPYPGEWAAFSLTALQSLLDAADVVTRGPRVRSAANAAHGLSSTSRDEVPAAE